MSLVITTSNPGARADYMSPRQYGNSVSVNCDGVLNDDINYDDEKKT